MRRCGSAKVAYLRQVCMQEVASTLALPASVAHDGRDLLRRAAHGPLLLHKVVLPAPEAAVAEVHRRGRCRAGLRLGAVPERPGSRAWGAAEQKHGQRSSGQFGVGWPGSAGRAARAPHVGTGLSCTLFLLAPCCTRLPPERLCQEGATPGPAGEDRGDRWFVVPLTVQKCSMVERRCQEPVHCTLGNWTNVASREKARSSSFRVP